MSQPDTPLRPSAPVEPPAGAAPAPTEPGARRARRALQWLAGLLAALLWIYFGLFNWLFPIIERRFDSPEIQPAGESAPAEDDPTLDLDATVDG